MLDFDGTVTQKDIGDEICDRFAPPAWREIDAAWVRNEISLPDAQRKMWGLARAERPEALAYAQQIGHLRPGLDDLLDAARRVGATLWLASGGFDFYIEALLGSRLGAFERSYFNATHFVGGRIEVDFPHRELACGRCAVCKGKVCDAARAGGRPISVHRRRSERSLRHRTGGPHLCRARLAPRAGLRRARRRLRGVRRARRGGRRATLKRART